MNDAAAGRRHRAFLLLAVLILAAAPRAGAGATIEMTSSDWSVSVDSGDLALGAGSDFADSSRQWGASDALITITPTVQFLHWYVTASLRVPGGESWPAAVEVYVIRTGNGTGTGTLAGALNTPVGPLSDAETDFFDGTRTRTNVPVTLEIDGLSATIPAGDYVVDVVYTVSL